MRAFLFNIFTEHMPPLMDEKTLEILYKTYELKITGRENHVDNFHKWMTFYSVAIGAILVAFCQYNENVLLSFLFVGFGLLTSFLFHLSCKGYKHWNDHWINEIWEFEEEIERYVRNLQPELPPYSTSKYRVFGRQPATGKLKINPLESAKISTPKVTMIFSFFTFVGWLVLLLVQIYKSIKDAYNNYDMSLTAYCIALATCSLITFSLPVILYHFSKKLHSDAKIIKPKNYSSQDEQ